MFEVPESRVRKLALERHYTAALDQGGLLVALCRSRSTDREPVFALVPRQRDQLIDIMHAFCYNARKAIELAEAYAPGTITHAKAIALHGFGETAVKLEIMEDAKPLSGKSLWWALGRIIHSQELAVHAREDVEVGTEWAPAPHLTFYETPVAASVRSDFDGPSDVHWFVIERLVEGFLALADKFAAALAGARLADGDAAV